MTISEANRQLAMQLQSIYDEREAINIAQWLMESLSGMKKSEIVIRKDENFTQQQEQHLKNMTVRLLNNEPIQYVLNEAWFYGSKLYVDENVLIPRTETEELVEWTLQSVQNSELRVKSELPKKRNMKILDVGTGSGCISIALRKNLSMQFEVWACDINDQVLTVARKNADDQHALIDFIPMDFLDHAQRKQLPHVDIVISNPPYVPLHDKNEMSPNVVKYEPNMALFVQDNDPLVFYNAIADFGKEKLYAEGIIFVEIHESMGESVTRLFKSKGYLSIELRKDLQGKDRMLKIRL